MQDEGTEGGGGGRKEGIQGEQRKVTREKGEERYWIKGGNREEEEEAEKEKEVEEGRNKGRTKGG